MLLLSIRTALHCWTEQMKAKYSRLNTTTTNKRQTCTAKKCENYLFLQQMEKKFCAIVLAEQSQSIKWFVCQRRNEYSWAQGCHRHLSSKLFAKTFPCLKFWDSRHLEIVSSDGRNWTKMMSERQRYLGNLQRKIFISFRSILNRAKTFKNKNG